MTIYGQHNFSWKKNELYQGKEKTGISVILYCPIDNLYRIRFSDGRLSSDYYNLTRAKDNAKKYEMRRLNMSEEEEVEESV